MNPSRIRCYSLEDVGAIGIALDLPVFESRRIAARIYNEQMKPAADQERLRKLQPHDSLPAPSARSGVLDRTRSRRP
jgi:hypothetical protein